MKKFYNAPDLSFASFKPEDILTASPIVFEDSLVGVDDATADGSKLF